MKILGINASPRKEGNCTALLKEAIKAAKDAGANAEIIFLDDLNITPWREELPKDDMGLIEAKIRHSEAIILASPIYFGSLSAQAKIMIDRFQGWWEKKILRGEAVRENKAKAGLILTEASDRKDFFQNAEQIARNFFAVIDAEYTDKLFCPGLEGPREALSQPDILKQAYELGKNLLQ